MNWILFHLGFTSLCHKITQDYMYVHVKKYPSNELDTLHRGTTSLCHKITRDCMYVNVKKNLSHELDTFTPRVYFSVAQDYTRLHVCQCEKMS